MTVQPHIDRMGAREPQSAWWALFITLTGWLLLASALVGHGSGYGYLLWALANPVGLTLGIVALQRWSRFGVRGTARARRARWCAWIAIVLGVIGITLTALAVLLVALWISNGAFE